MTFPCAATPCAATLTTWRLCLARFLSLSPASSTAEALHPHVGCFCYTDPMTALDIQWFRDRIGQTVIRSYDGRDVEFEVTEKNCGYLQLFSQKGYTFRLKAT